MQAKRSRLPTLAGLLLLSVARADELPPVNELKERMQTPTATVAVYEPHETGIPGTDETLVEYLGYPANDVMAFLFGNEWHGEGDTIELKALDGYIARIEVARFLKETAYLVFARADGTPFTVDNLRQNTTDVPLGPYYLVWDNVANPDLIDEGAIHWPYQVHEINRVSLSERALVPAGIDASLHEGARLTREYCLQCHKVNGFGGDKFPGNLALLARAQTEADFIRIVLTPSSVRSTSQMPPVAYRLPEDERRRIARALFDYLTAVPIVE